MNTTTVEEALRGRRVLVTGASGFIGQHLTQRLLEYQCAVHATSRRPISRSDVFWHSVDISNPDSIHQVVVDTQPEIIYHLASLPEIAPRLLEDEIYYKAMILGTHSLLAAAAALHDVRVVMAGSAKEYGLAATSSLNNTPLHFRETDPAIPVTPYALAKLTASLMGQMYHRSLGLSVVSLRLFSTYGPGMDTNSIVVQAIRAALAGESLAMTLGEQKRDLLYVSDVVDGFLRAACSVSCMGLTINLCSGQAIRVRFLVETIYKLVGTAGSINVGGIPYRREELWNLCGDPALARKVLGWQARVGLEEGLKRTIEWYSLH